MKGKLFKRDSIFAEKVAEIEKLMRELGISIESGANNELIIHNESSGDMALLVDSESNYVGVEGFPHPFDYRLKVIENDND